MVYIATHEWISISIHKYIGPVIQNSHTPSSSNLNLLDRFKRHVDPFLDDRLQA